MHGQFLHHVSIAVRDVARSRRFYREILGLEEIERPPFPFDGAWFSLGPAQQLHLVHSPEGTFRDGKGLNRCDSHFAVRVDNYDEALCFLESKGYGEDAHEMSSMKLISDRHAVAGYPQIYILDPDRHVIEINAEPLG